MNKRIIDSVGDFIARPLLYKNWMRWMITALNRVQYCINLLLPTSDITVHEKQKINERLSTFIPYSRFCFFCFMLGLPLGPITCQF